ncbi:MAG: LacI family transcriptional regulator [Lentisphaerae bacterium]|nr:MAG: LacI family transcriptional regulator [Lentisphaerota bacterium]
MSKRKRKVVTRNDVARKAQVSPSAVSLVLNNTPGVRISKQTRARILAAANELGYRPSAIARAVSTGRTHTIGVLLCNTDQIFEPYTAFLLQGIWPTLREHQYRLTIDALTKDRDIAIFCREHAADGVIIIAPPDNVTGVDLIIDQGYPAVSVGSELAPEVDYVDLDNSHAAYLATSYLIRMGHRRIAHLTGDIHMSSGRERLWGYRRALAEAGIEFDPNIVIESYYGEREKSITHARELLSRRHDHSYTAVFAGSDEIAGSFVEAAQEIGLGIPEDISVIGINGFPQQTTIVDRSIKLLSTIRQPFLEIGSRAARLVLQRLNEKETPRAQKLLLRGELVEGHTVRRLSS